METPAVAQLPATLAATASVIIMCHLPVSAVNCHLCLHCHLSSVICLSLLSSVICCHLPLCSLLSATATVCPANWCCHLSSPSPVNQPPTPPTGHTHPAICEIFLMLPPPAHWSTAPKNQNKMLATQVNFIYLFIYKSTFIVLRCKPMLYFTNKQWFNNE